MVKVSVVEKNKCCCKLVVGQVNKCVVFKVVIMNQELFIEEWFKVILKFVVLLCNGLKICVCNCCEVIGCLCVYYCKFKMLCIVFCEFGNFGFVLGFVKLSW